MSTGATPTAREQQRVARAPNVMALLGHDHALRVGMGLALADFKPAAALLPLGPDQKRYVVDASALPGDVLQRGEKQRVCIEDVSSGKRRLECPASLATSCRTLHLRVDQGSIGWPAAHFLFTRGGIGGSFFWDPAHRFHNDVRGALVASDLWMKVIECTLAFNMPQGPWSKASFFRKACQCADDFFITQNEHHPHFLHFFEQMALDLDPVTALPWGSDEHLRHVWDLAKVHNTFFRRGLKIKLCRWMSFWDRVEEMMSSWTVMLFSLALIGLEEGWLDRVADVEYAHSKWVEGVELVSGEDAKPGDAVAVTASTHSGAPASSSTGPYVPSVPAAAGGVGSTTTSPGDLGAEAPRGVKQSNAEVDKLRKQCKNTCHVACKILGNFETAVLVRSMAMLIKPVRMNFGQTLVKILQRDAGLVWLASMANEEWSEELNAIMSSFGDQVALQRCRFDIHEDTLQDQAVVVKLVRLATNPLWAFA